MTWLEPAPVARVHELEVAHATLDSKVDGMARRLDDVREVLDDLSGKLDVVSVKLDAAAVDRARSTAEATASAVALGERLRSLEATKAQVAGGLSWLASRAGPVILALASGAALSESAKAALRALLAP